MPDSKIRVGSRSISLRLGGYGSNPFFYLQGTVVLVGWAFDDQDTLIEIVVNKLWDGL